MTSRAAAVRRLAACEKQFVLQMQTGVTNYVIALRHSDVVSRNDHDTLFINLETVNICAVKTIDSGPPNLVHMMILGSLVFYYAPPLIGGGIKR